MIDAGAAATLHQVVVQCGCAGVNHRDADTGTVVAQIAANHRGSHGGSGPLHRANDRPILGNLRNERMPGQRQERRVG